MKNDPENKNFTLDHIDSAQDNINSMMQVGKLEIIIRVSNLLGWIASLLLILIGIGFCSIKFSFVTATITLIFAIFIFFKSDKIDRLSYRYLAEIAKIEENRQKTQHKD